MNHTPKHALDLIFAGLTKLNNEPAPQATHDRGIRLSGIINAIEFHEYAQKLMSLLVTLQPLLLSWVEIALKSRCTEACPTFFCERDSV